MQANPFILVGALLLLAFPVTAQTPAPTPEGPIAISGGTVHTVTQGSIPGGTVLFEDGIITAVGANVDIPEGTRIFDATGKHVYPGFIHGHTTLGLMEIARIQESTDLQETGDINPNIRVHAAFHSASEHLPVAAVHGVTTVIPSPRGSLLAGRLAAMATDGWTWEEMTIREDIGMVIEWPSMGNSESYAERMEILQKAFDSARRYHLARTAMQTGDGIPQHHPIDLRWEAMIPLLERQMPAFVSASGIRQIQAAIAWAEKEGIDIVITGSRDVALIADQLAKKQIPVVLPGVISGPTHQWEGYDEAYSIPRKLHEAGVVFCIAGDAGAASAYRMHHHAASAAAFGLPPEEALRSITINAARIFGIDDILGSIEEGKHATLMITDGDPLELWTKKEQVIIKGRMIDMTDKHKRLYEHYMEKHRQKHMQQ